MDNQSLLEEIGLFLMIAEEESSFRKTWPMLSRVGDIAKNVAEPTLKYAKAAHGYYKTHKEPIKKYGKVISVAALVAGGVYAYDRFFTAAAKKCVGYAGAEKTECMKRVRAGATDAEIGELKKSMSLCNQSSDPMTCKKRMKDRLTKLSDQLYQLRSGILLKD